MFEFIFQEVIWFFFQTHLKRNTICGSNKLIYANRCELDRDQCLKQQEIRERHLNYCLGILNILNKIKVIYLSASKI